MLVQKISSLNSVKKNDIAFKNRLTFDVGASDPRGSLKILVQDDKGKDLFEYKGFVSDSTKGFVDNDDFTSKIARATDVESLIAKDIKNIDDQLLHNNLTVEDAEKLEIKRLDLREKQEILQNQTPEEKKVSGFALLLPGTIQGHIALFMANLRKTDEKSLTNVNLNNVILEAKKNNIVEFSDDFDINKDFIPCKDLAGTGIGITQKVINHPKYEDNFSKGYYVVAVQTGGGFGAVDIKTKTDRKVDIETNECSHDLFYDKKTGTEKRLGKLGASTGSVIENFSDVFGINSKDDVKALIKTGLAQIATQSTIKLNNEKDAKAIKVLLDTDAYEAINETSTATTLKVKDEYMDKFNEASRYAMESYADAIALHAITRINRGVNLYVLSGPLAMGLNDTIKENPDVYGAKDMRELVFGMIDKRVGDDVTCNILREAHNFDIVCDRSMSVDNNTSGGSLLLAGDISTFARRGEWMRIPKKVLKTAEE